MTKLPIAETFHSIQGEGYWVGTPMFFIRLAGCSVGHPGIGKPPGTESGFAPTLPTGKHAWECKRWDGTPFWCDTDFNKYHDVPLNDLLEGVWEHHVCVTGGEPMIHLEHLYALLEVCHANNKIVHIETSGTIPIPDDLHLDWITCSPKQGYLPEVITRANEVKLLIDAAYPVEFPDYFDHAQVFLSPINDVHNLAAFENVRNLRYAETLLRYHPNWRLSVQLHKYLGVK